MVISAETVKRFCIHLKLNLMFKRTLILLLFPIFIGLSTTSSQAQITVVNERGINTAFQEYSPTFYHKGLVFIASNPAVNTDKKEDAQLGQSTTSIFYAKRGNDGNLQRPIAFADELTTKFYDGPLSFNATGDVVFFTRTNLRKGKLKVGRDGKVKLKIYSAKLNISKGVWENIEELPFNSNNFDCMHPSVSADGQQLYFASNRPGGRGGLDLYVSLMQRGKWGVPINLGDSVNTSKNEIFPFIHPDNTLYFATNGRKAVGGFDIFWTKKNGYIWLPPTAMPEPINSPSDDFGIILTDDKRSGFFSSNRASGQGDDDIFSFFDGSVDIHSLKNSINSDGIQDKRKQTKLEEMPNPSPASDKKGEWKEKEYEDRKPNPSVARGDSKVAAFMVKPFWQSVIVNSKGLVLHNDTLPTPLQSVGATDWNDGKRRDNDFEEPQYEIMDSEPVASHYKFEMRNIYYGVGDAEVNEEAKTELAPLLKMMLKDPKIEIEIASHTDSRGKAVFNMSLSQLRADNIKTVFVEKGISPDRIRAFGYGETMIRNQCKRGVNCSEEEHAQNRRTVIKIVKGVETQPIVEIEKPIKRDIKPTKVINTEGGDFMATTALETNNLARTTPSNKRYYVIIGTYTKPENALKQQKKAVEAGFVDAEVVQYKDTQLYGVNVRLFGDQNEARKLSDYINSQKIFEAFVKELK